MLMSLKYLIGSAKEIAFKLHEDKIDLILRCVQLLGKERVIELFQSTKEVENDGGIMVAVSYFQRIKVKYLVYQANS